MRCPRCRSPRIVKNGTKPAWKAGKKMPRVQMFRCNRCGRQFREKKTK